MIDFRFRGLIGRAFRTLRMALARVWVFCSLWVYEAQQLWCWWRQIAFQPAAFSVLDNVVHIHSLRLMIFMISHFVNAGSDCLYVSLLRCFLAASFFLNAASFSRFCLIFSLYFFCLSTWVLTILKLCNNKELLHVWRLCIQAMVYHVSVDVYKSALRLGLEKSSLMIKCVYNVLHT